MKKSLLLHGFRASCRKCPRSGGFAICPHKTHKKQKKDNSLSFNGMTMDCKSIHVCTMHCGRIANPPERDLL